MSHEGREQDDHDRSIRSEERLCQIEEKWVAHAVVHDLEAQALALQHVEYERRLADLNHEAQRIAADKLTFASAERVDAVDGKIEALTGTVGITLPREVFDTFLRETYKSETERRDGRLDSLERTTLTTDNYNREHQALAGRISTLERTTVSSETFDQAAAERERRLKVLEDWKARAAGFGALIAILSGVIGAAIAKALG